MFENNILLRATVGSLLFTTLASALFLGMPAVKAGNDVVDRVSVIVPVSCSMSSSLTTNHIAEINNGQTTSEIGTTNITAFCNDNSGYAIYAIGYTDNQYGNNVLESSSLDKKYVIKTSNTIDAANSSWAMKLTAVSGTYTPIIVGSNADAEKEQGDPDFSDYQSVPEEYTKVAYYPVATEVGSLATGSSFTTTYRAHISPTQPAGTYIGQVKYTLVHPNGDFPFPEDTLVGTTLRFNEHIDVESLLPLHNENEWHCSSLHNLHFAVKITVTDILDHLGVQNPNVTTWSQLVDMVPGLLASIGATDIESNMQVLDESQSYSYINYTGLCPSIYTYGEQDESFLWFCRNGYGDDVSDWSYLPPSTGSISYTLDGDSYIINSIGELIGMSSNGAWLDENYYQGDWSEEFFRTITIYGGNEVEDQALIQWIKDNSTVLYIDTLTTDEWTFNETVLSESSMYWDVGGTIYSNQYTAYHFDYIDTNTDYGVPIWSFFYNQVTEPYERWDGFVYVSEDLSIPEQGINYSAGWYFGNGQNPAGYIRVSPPTITLEDGEDLYNPAFTAWLHQNANAN